MAGEPGTDPRSSVLETDSFPVSLFPCGAPGGNRTPVVFVRSEVHIVRSATGALKSFPSKPLGRIRTKLSVLIQVHADSAANYFSKRLSISNQITYFRIRMNENKSVSRFDAVGKKMEAVLFREIQHTLFTKHSFHLSP